MFGPQVEDGQERSREVGMKSQKTKGRFEATETLCLVEGALGRPEQLEEQ